MLPHSFDLTLKGGNKRRIASRSATIIKLTSRLLEPKSVSFSGGKTLH